jgi:hypothetical protein
MIGPYFCLPFAQNDVKPADCVGGVLRSGAPCGACRSPSHAALRISSLARRHHRLADVMLPCAGNRMQANAMQRTDLVSEHAAVLPRSGRTALPQSGYAERMREKQVVIHCIEQIALPKDSR